MYNKIGICFSSEDRGNFLDSLIRRLRINSRTIISELEIYPSLHQNSSTRINFMDFYATILIISSHNKDSDWVRDALKIAKKQTFSDPHKIIPVIIENCFLPEDPPGEQTINLFDHEDYAFELFNIRSLAGLHNSDYLNYNNSIHLIIPNMSEFVNKLFLLICNETISIDYPLISIPEFLNKNHFQISRKFDNALKDLVNAGFIEKLSPAISTKKGNSDVIRVSSAGLNKYLYMFYQNYANLRKSVIEFILQNNPVHTGYMLKSEIIAKTLRQPKLVVNTILEDLDSNGKIILERTHGENWEVSKIQHLMFENILEKGKGNLSTNISIRD